MSVVLASMYWIIQAGAILFPGSSLVDPELAHKGQPQSQLIVDLVMLLMLAFGYAIELR